MLPWSPLLSDANHSELPLGILFFDDLNVIWVKNRCKYLTTNAEKEVTEALKQE